ncbi:MAG TPA: RHS repeat domain-containing protein, partial [Kribbella sp.]
MRRTRSALVTLLGISLLAGVASYVPETEAKAYSRPAPPVQESNPIHGQDFRGRGVQPAAATTPQGPVQRPVWPAATSAVLNLGTAKAATAAGSAPQKVGVSPVTVSAAPATTKAAAASPSSVRVNVLDQAQTEKLGVQGLVLRVGRADRVATPGRVRVQVDYSDFKFAYGGDWASRLRMVKLDCAAGSACSKVTPVLGSTIDAKAGKVSADVELPAAKTGAEATTFAVAAAPEGPNGSFSATTLAPASTWGVGKQTGDFNWSYPLRVPPGTAGPRPELSISYSSGSLDGMTASTNNQGSWLGQGHTLEAGYVERKYVSCADDMDANSNNTTKTGDLCWKTDNATLSLGSHSSELLWDATQNKWKLRNDDGSRIQRLAGAANGAQGGEYWRLTTTDGTQYYFGLNPVANGTARTDSVSLVPVYGNHANEPCHQATFAASQCQQAWRWNVDRVVDPAGNVMLYRYVQEKNYYGRNNNTAVSSYDRASYLTSIEYGKRVGAETANPPARVVFGVTERCFPSGTITCAPDQLTATNASYWPDVPFDQICASSTTCPNRTSPAFFTRKRLYTISTQTMTGTTARTVDTWNFGQSLDDPGDGTSKGLWLANIVHKGMVGGTVTDPTVSFIGKLMPNRVGDFTGGAQPMNKKRLNSITTESGAVISVQYSATECPSAALPAESSAPTNTKRCFPVYWTREGGSGPTLHWFHKYVVTSTLETDAVTDAPSKETTYTYSGSPAWHFDDNELTLQKYRTWGDWRGYGSVSVQEGPPGAQTSSRYLFFRGMHGDRLDKAGTTTKSVSVVDSANTSYLDYDRLNGFLREQITYNGAGGAEVGGTISTPWLKQTGTGGGNAALLLQTGYTRVRTRLSDGTYRVAGVNTDFDALGMPTEVSDLGDVSRGDDDRCTRYTYNRNDETDDPVNAPEDTWITDAVSRKETVSVSCASTPSRPAQVLSDERTYYDQSTGIATKPTVGLVSKVETMTSWNGGPVYEQRARMVYDSLGRITQTYDGLNRLTSSVEFVPATSGPVTGMNATDAAGNVSRTTLESAWGTPVVQLDANGKRTDLTYDASGRLASVWLPDRSKAAGKTASAIFSYLLSNTAGQPNVVASQELLPNDTYKTSRTLFDGFLRQRQVQTPSANGVGRVISDTMYTNRGVVAFQGGPYFDDSTAPTNKLNLINEILYPSQTVYTVDGANRVTAEVFKSQSSEKWRTTTTYGGDFTAVDPPAGQTPTMTVADARGKTVELRQFQGASASGAYDSTFYTYTPKDELETVKNAGGSTWRYSYDLRGRQTSAVDPDKGTTLS